jgi:hypothetical protein
MGTTLEYVHPKEIWRSIDQSAPIALKTEMNLSMDVSLSSSLTANRRRPADLYLATALEVTDRYS